MRHWLDRMPAAPSLHLVEVTPRPAPRPTTSLRVVVGEVAIVVDDNFVDDTLARVLRVVRAC